MQLDHLRIHSEAVGSAFSVQSLQSGPEPVERLVDDLSGHHSG